MKKIKKMSVFMLIAVMSFLFSSCGSNNEGPFNYEYRNGESILTSAGKPASGVIRHHDYFNGAEVVVYEAEFDDGFIDGKCKIYNIKNILVYEGNFKKKNNDMYDINLRTNNGSILKGTVQITSEELLYMFTLPFEYGKTDLKVLFDNRVIDGEYKDNVYTATKKNGVFVGKREINSENHILKEVYSENGELLEFYEEDNGLVFKKGTPSNYEQWQYIGSKIYNYWLFKDGEEYCHWNDTHQRLCRRVTPEDNPTKIKADKNTVVIVYLRNDKYYIEIGTSNEYINILKNSTSFDALSSTIPNYEISLDTAMEIYYQVIGSDKAKNK